MPLASSSFAEPTDNANVSFVTYKGDYYVSTETNVMHKVDPETLEATKRVRCCTELLFIDRQDKTGREGSVEAE